MTNYTTKTASLKAAKIRSNVLFTDKINIKNIDLENELKNINNNSINIQTKLKEISSFHKGNMICINFSNGSVVNSYFVSNENENQTESYAEIAITDFGDGEKLYLFLSVGDNGHLTETITGMIGLSTSDANYNRIMLSESNFNDLIESPYKIFEIGEKDDNI